MAALTCLMYSTFFLEDKYLIYYNIGSDSIGQSVPFFLNAADRFSESVFSTWNPSQFLGSPTVQLFNPEYFVSWFGRDAVPVMMLISQMVKVILAGVFFYLFIGYYEITYPTRFAASLGVAFCGRMLALSPWTAYTAEIALLAALLWGIERAICCPKKFVALPVSFALIVMTLSVYGLVLYSAVLVMYTVFSLCFLHCHEEKRIVVGAIRRIALLYFCGVLLSCPSLLVYLDSYTHSARVSQSSSLASMLSGILSLSDPQIIAESYLKLLTPSVSGFMDEPIGYLGFLDTPYLYCGLLSILGLPFAFRNKSPRQRIMLALLLIFAAAYILFAGFRYLLNGGSVEASSFRMSSTWIILVIALVGALGLDQLWALSSQKAPLVWVLLLAAMAAVACLLLPGHFRILRVLFPLVVILVYAMLVCLFHKTRCALIPLIVLAIVPVEILVQGHRLVNDVPAQTTESYDATFRSGLAELLDEETADDMPARVDYQTDLLTSPMANTYLGTESYIGGVGSYENVTNFLSTIGNDYIEHLGYSRYSYGFSDPSLNALLGVKYVVYPNESHHYAPLGYNPQSAHGYYRLLNNTEAPGFFSFYSEDDAISRDAYLSVPRESRGSLLLHAMVLPDELEANEHAGTQLIEELRSCLAHGKELGVTRATVDAKQAQTFEVEESDSEYVAICLNLSATPTVSGNVRATVTLSQSAEDESPVTVPLYLAAGNETIYIPVRNEGFNLVSVSIDSVNACDDAKFTDISLEEVPDAYIDYYFQGCTERAEANAVVTSYTNDSVSTTINAPDDGYMLVPIPQSDSWHVYIDGVEQETFEADYAFIGFRVSSGSHALELVYRDAAYEMGLVIFACSLSALAMCKVGSILKRRRQSGNHFAR